MKQARPGMCCIGTDEEWERRARWCADVGAVKALRSRDDGPSDSLTLGGIIEPRVDSGVGARCGACKRCGFGARARSVKKDQLRARHRLRNFLLRHGRRAAGGGNAPGR